MCWEVLGDNKLVAWGWLPHKIYQLSREVAGKKFAAFSGFENHGLFKTQKEAIRCCENYERSLYD